MEDQVGDGVGKGLDPADSQLGRDVFYARERIGVRAFAAEEFGQGLHVRLSVDYSALDILRRD